MTADENRRGAALVTGELRLTLDEVRDLLAACAHVPIPEQGLVPYADAPVPLLSRLWGDLAAVRPDLARAAFDTALLDPNAHPMTVATVATVITTNKETP
jgi:hypothetical protein